MTRVLVVDDDVDIARFLEINLLLEGFEVQVAHGGREALERVAEQPPDLVLTDVMMPGVDGVELCRRLRADAATAHVPVIMLSAKDLSADKVVGFAAGADDYVLKPFDTFELVARVRSTLRRNAEMRSVSPLTGLPGNTRIEVDLAARLAAGGECALSYFDIDHFKAFNDRYGFIRGDEVIQMLASTLAAVAATLGPGAFVGHVGGDDFVLVCDEEAAEDAAGRVVDAFRSGVVRLHDPEDVAAGCLVVVDRQGVPQRFSLLSVSAGVAMSSRLDVRDHRRLVAVATEMKSVAKAAGGGQVAVDRRASTTGPGIASVDGAGAHVTMA